MTSSISIAKRRLEAIQKTLISDQHESTSTPEQTQNPPFPFPIQNSTIPFWRTELHPLDGHRSTRDLPARCDIVIIGAGYTGASMVHHLLDGNEDKDAGNGILILEAREACSGATGRNGSSLSLNTFVPNTPFGQWLDILKLTRGQQEATLNQTYTSIVSSSLFFNHPQGSSTN